MRSLLALILVLLCIKAEATHIIGGNMYYDHLGGNQYRVTLVLYRDCGPDNANNTGFDTAAQLAVYNSSGGQITSASVAFAGEVPVPVELNDPCLTAPPTVCVRTAVYQQVFNLPPIAGGYTISYQRCCRTQTALVAARTWSRCRRRIGSSAGEPGRGCVRARPHVVRGQVDSRVRQAS